MNNKFNRFAVLAAFGAQFMAGCVVPGAYTYDTYGTTTYMTGGTLYATPAYHTEVTYVETMAAPRLHHYAAARHGKHHKPPAGAYYNAKPRCTPKATAAPKPAAAPRPRNEPRAHAKPAAPKPAAAPRPRNEPKAHAKPAPTKPAHAPRPHNAPKPKRP